jgi:hypothetical protein
MSTTAHRGYSRPSFNKPRTKVEDVRFAMRYYLHRGGLNSHKRIEAHRTESGISVHVDLGLPLQTSEKILGISLDQIESKCRWACEQFKSPVTITVSRADWS